MGSFESDETIQSGSDRMSKHFSNEKRIRLVEAYIDNSPLTLKAYALANGVGYSTFQKWVSKHGVSLKSKKAKAVGFNFLKPGNQDHGSKMAPVKLVNDEIPKASSLPIEFMDITAKVFPPPIEERAFVDTLDPQNFIPHVPNVDAVDPLALSCQLDVFLPNGIRMRFDQASLNNSIAMIKALV